METVARKQALYCNFIFSARLQNLCEFQFSQSELSNSFQIFIIHLQVYFLFHHRAKRFLACFFQHFLKSPCAHAKH